MYYILKPKERAVVPAGFSKKQKFGSMLSKIICEKCSEVGGYHVSVRSYNYYAVVIIAQNNYIQCFLSFRVTNTTRMLIHA